VDEIFRTGKGVGEGFFEILSQPDHVRMSRNVDMEDLPCRMLYDKEDIEGCEVPCRHNEIIHRSDLRGVQIKEIFPVTSGSILGFHGHVLANGVDVNTIAGHLELAENTFRPPR